MVAVKEMARSSMFSQLANSGGRGINPVVESEPWMPMLMENTVCFALELIMNDSILIRTVLEGLREPGPVMIPGNACVSSGSAGF